MHTWWQVTSKNACTPDNFRAYSAQTVDDHRLQPDSPVSNIYDNESQVFYLNGYHDKAHPVAG